MALEWLRRNDAKWDEVLRTYLFKDAPITEIEKEAEAAGEPPTDLSLGDLRKEPPR